MKGKNLNQEYSTQQDSPPSDMLEKSKSRQAKVKRIQHHQTSFITNAKGTSIRLSADVSIETLDAKRE